MLDRLFPSHLTDLQNGLDLAAKRQGLLMDNLANANVPGYKRQDVDFNVTLQDEIGKTSGLPGGFGPNGEAATDEGSVRVDDSSVDPEQEAMGVAQTELRFGTISDMTAGYFAGLKNAIREGR